MTNRDAEKLGMAIGFWISRLIRLGLIVLVVWALVKYIIA